MTFVAALGREILETFSSEQLRRYEHFRRSNFQKSSMKKIINGLTGASASVPLTIVVSSAAKMFVGDLVETGEFSA